MCLKSDPLGSLQVYVETDCDLLNPGVFEHVRQNVSSDHFSDLQLFCFVMGQWDTGVHNLLAVKENPEDVQEKAMRLIAIDNAGIANMQRVRYGEPAFVCVSDPSNIGDIRKEVFPFADALVMTKPDHAKLREALLQCVPPLADDPLVKAMRFYGAAPLHYVVWKGALWRQFHGSNPTDEGYLLCKADTISENMKSKLQGLNLKTVRDFFPAGSKEALGEACFEDLVHYVLKRRDQVLAFL